jgi:hypothetical protein
MYRAVDLLSRSLSLSENQADFREYRGGKPPQEGKFPT